MRLRKERKAAKLTQAELGRLAQVSQGQISQMERGNLLAPTYETLRRLAVALQKCGRRVTEGDLQPRKQPLLVKGARSERRGKRRAA